MLPTAAAQMPAIQASPNERPEDEADRAKRAEKAKEDDANGFFKRTRDGESLAKVSVSPEQVDAELERRLENARGTKKGKTQDSAEQG